MKTENDMEQHYLNLALQFLRDHHDVALATVESNKPKLRIFQVMAIEGATLYFATSPRKDVWRQLQACPAVELIGLHDQVSVRCVGQACFDVPDAMQRHIFATNPVLPRLYEHYDQLGYFSVPISQLDYYDLRPTPPVLKHLDLTTGEAGDGFVGEKFMKKR